MVKALWNSGCRKETMDMLKQLWPILDDDGRVRLSKAILAGPPLELLAHLDDSEATVSRDRRIFDRITILERIGDPPLNDSLQREYERLQELHPSWKVTEGEQAHFSSWMEFRHGPETRFTVDDLKAMPNQVLINVLLTEREFRPGLLEIWRHLAIEDRERAFEVLELLVRAENPEAADLWQRGLWGLRDGATDDPDRTRLLRLITLIPNTLIKMNDVVGAATDILDALSPKAGDTPLFWQVFERLLPIVSDLQEMAEEPQRGDWVSLAINRPLGRLTGAFLNAMFGRGLKVGQGLPEDLRPFLDQLLHTNKRAHRVARVVAASRLSYLFAVDPDWTKASLLPGFRWDDEDETIALWQGYSWHAQIDPQLWVSLRPHFIQLFTEARLDKLRNQGYRRNIGQILMLVGLEFGVNALTREEARAAIRAMSNHMREAAVAWLADFLEQQSQEIDVNTRKADDLWKTRVVPWLRKVWPAEPGCRSIGVSEQFGLAAIATHECFPGAIEFIEPFIVPTRAFLLLSKLDMSDHPTERPDDTMQFLEMLIDPETDDLREETLRSILDKIVAAMPEVHDDQRYRKWNELLRRRDRLRR